jgi:hypothetical protein
MEDITTTHASTLAKAARYVIDSRRHRRHVPKHGVFIPMLLRMLEIHRQNTAPAFNMAPAGAATLELYITIIQFLARVFPTICRRLARIHVMHA